MCTIRVICIRVGILSTAGVVALKTYMRVCALPHTKSNNTTNMAVVAEGKKLTNLYNIINSVPVM